MTRIFTFISSASIVVIISYAWVTKITQIIFHTLQVLFSLIIPIFILFSCHVTKASLCTRLFLINTSRERLHSAQVRSTDTTLFAFPPFFLLATSKIILCFYFCFIHVNLPREKSEWMSAFSGLTTPASRMVVIGKTHNSLAGVVCVVAELQWKITHFRAHFPLFIVMNFLISSFPPHHTTASTTRSDVWKGLMNSHHAYMMVCIFFSHNEASRGKSERATTRQKKLSTRRRAEWVVAWFWFGGRSSLRIKWVSFCMCCCVHSPWRDSHSTAAISSPVVVVDTATHNITLLFLGKKVVVYNVRPEQQWPAKRRKKRQTTIICGFNSTTLINKFRLNFSFSSWLSSPCLFVFARSFAVIVCCECAHISTMLRSSSTFHLFATDK